MVFFNIRVYYILNESLCIAYLWSADLSKTFSQLIISIFIFSQYFFNILCLMKNVSMNHNTGNVGWHHTFPMGEICHLKDNAHGKLKITDFLLLKGYPYMNNTSVAFRYKCLCRAPSFTSNRIFLKNWNNLWHTWQPKDKTFHISSLKYNFNIEILFWPDANRNTMQQKLFHFLLYTMKLELWQGPLIWNNKIRAQN